MKDASNIRKKKLSTTKLNIIRRALNKSCGKTKHGENISKSIQKTTVNIKPVFIRKFHIPLSLRHKSYIKVA